MELDYMEILKLSMIQTFSCKVLWDVISSDIFSCKAHGGMFALNTWNAKWNIQKFKSVIIFVSRLQEGKIEKRRGQMPAGIYGLTP